MSGDGTTLNAATNAEREAETLQLVLQRMDRLEQTVRNVGAERNTPTRIEWFKCVTDTLTLVVIIGGLLLSWKEVDRWKKGNDATEWNELSKKWLELDRYFVDHHDVRKYFYDGARLPTDENEQSKVVGISYYVLDFTDWVLTSLDLSVTADSPDGLRQRVAWESYFKNTVFKSPAACALLLKGPDGYGKTTQNIGLETCKGI